MIGQTVSHYTILEKLGEGGMGVVYKAEDTRLKRIVALKFLPQHLTSTTEDRARFLQEAQAAAMLNHPNICTIHAIEEHEGRQFIDMEFVDGASLRTLLPVKSLPEALAYAKQIGDALQEAHSHGVVHRDVKCDNIVINAKRQAKVMDFGLAKFKGAANLTRTSSTVGTTAYMAPEQLLGGEADARSDIFSFGVVFYEMLAGRKPFRGEHEAAMSYSIVNEEPTPLTAHRGDLPAGLMAIVEKMLKKNPDERYQSVDRILADLAGITGAAEAPKEAGITSLAVLAFEDMSSGKDQDYLCEGLAEELINALTKVGKLRVSARTSAFAFKGKQMDMREIGRKLGVQAVLEGSVRKAGSRLRISAQLISVADGYHIWSERYDRELRDVFEIQDEIADNIVRALKLVLTEQEKVSVDLPQTSVVEAYEYYLRGRRLFHAAKRNQDEAIQMFTRATELDPRYALAYCGLADCHSWRYLYHKAAETVLAEAEKASRMAIELQPNLAEAHASLGLAVSLRKAYDEAEREFARAISLDPKNFEAHYFYGRTCFSRGDFAGAAREFEECARVRLEDFQSELLLADVYRSLKADQPYRDALKNGVARVERHLALNPTDARAWYMGGGAWIQLGETEKGEQWVLRATELDPESVGTLYNAACAFAQLGKVERAIDFLESALRNGFAHRAWVEHDGDLDPLRAHPRFVALLASMK
jgi:TolB-like protein/Flp pilus assembly protein TadD/predicted Ser/Thr protein kinase